MVSLLSDKNFFLSGGGERASNASLANASSTNGQIIKQPDGSYQIYGVRKTGKYDFSVRMNVNSSDSYYSMVEECGDDRICQSLVCSIIILDVLDSANAAEQVLA